jgi:hypothetical protein
MQTKTTLFFILVFTGINTMAQYPCYNGISTNPLNPINTQLPSKQNTFFNWQDSLWAMQPSAFCFRTGFNESPFYKIDNLEELRESKDMRWDDGWELIRRFVGLTETNTYTASNPEHLYVVLYNKYTGILRVLLLACRGADYNAAKITFKFHGSTEMKTDLMEFSRGQVSGLDKKFTDVIFAAASKYLNENNKYFYADFPVMYDPCTCNYKSKLNIISELVSTSSINIEGGITGDILTKDVGGKGQVEKPGTYSWKDFSSTVNGKVTAVHGSVNQFKTQTQKLAENFSRTDTSGKKNAVGQFASFLESNTFLQAGLNAFPWLKSAISLVDAFAGGGKTTAGPQEVKLLPLSVNLTAKLSGTISTTNPYHNIIFTNPGSKDAALDPDNYPYYNEVLGIFNLLRNPVMYHQTNYGDITEYGGSEYGINVVSNKYHFLLDSFKYVLNPAADLTIQNMQVAMLVEAVPTSGGICSESEMNRSMTNFIFEGKDALTDVYKFRTEYFDVNCFNQQIFDVVSYYGRSVPESGVFEASCWRPLQKAYLKFMINLKRNNATATTQNVLYVVTYPLNLKTYDIDNNFTPGTYCIDSSIVPAASVTEVNSFCNSTVYYNLDRQSRMYRDSITGQPQIVTGGVGVFPNPNTGTFSYKIKPRKGALKQIVIDDMQGRNVYIENYPNISLIPGFTRQLNLNLKPGTYLLKAFTDVDILTSKFIVFK